MSRQKEIITAFGVLACAASIGMVMQSSDTAKARYGNVEPPQVTQGVKSSAAILSVRAITLTSGELEAGVAVPATDDEIAHTAAPAPLPQPQMPNADPVPACEMTATARPVAGAMVRLGMTAACLPNERLTVHHNGMIFSEITSATGTIDLTLPALAEDAVFVLAFSNGEGAVAQTMVEDLSDYRRVVVQWKGDTGFEIHAREFGADYGAEGHIWSGAPGEIADAVTGKSGVITRLGDLEAPEALIAEVYSFPTDAGGRTGDIALTVEAEVTQANCGLELEAQALQLSASGDLSTRNLSLSVPECDASGSFLVLNNLLEDLKVAAR